MDVAQSKQESNSEHINHQGICLPVRNTPLLHAATSAESRLVLVECPIRKALALEAPYCLNGLHSLRDCGTTKKFPVITRLVIIDLLTHCVDKLVSVRLLYSLGICADFIVGHIKSNRAEGISNNQIKCTIIELVELMSVRDHAISIGHIKAKCI